MRVTGLSHRMRVTRGAAMVAGLGALVAVRPPDPAHGAGLTPRLMPGNRVRERSAR